MKPDASLLLLIAVASGCTSSEARPGPPDPVGPDAVTEVSVNQPPVDVATDRNALVDSGGAEQPDSIVEDVALVDAADISSDAPSDLGVEPPADLGTQRSCPDPSERGCGLIFVRGGPFVMGGDPMAALDLPPQTMIKVSSFAMDVFEVTVARFQRFWAGGHPDVHGPIDYPGGTVDDAGPVQRPTSRDMIGRCNWTDGFVILESHPMNCLDWNTAQAFCVWDGGRLPTEAEWEYAARGRAVAGLLPARTWPWGEATPSPTCDRLHWNLCPGDDDAATRRVGSFAPNGGIYDLAGNVLEWLADWYLPYTDSVCWGDVDRTDPICTDPRSGTRSVRSAGFLTYPASFYHPAAHLYIAPTTTGIDQGVRCVRTVRR